MQLLTPPISFSAKPVFLMNLPHVALSGLMAESTVDVGVGIRLLAPGCRVRIGHTHLLAQRRRSGLSWFGVGLDIFEPAPPRVQHALCNFAEARVTARVFF